MATLVRLQAVWNGFQGAPGYTHWYGISDGDAAAAANALGARMRAFFSAIAGYIPSGSDVKVQRLYQVINDTNGAITSEGLQSTDPAVVNGAGSGNYAAPAGVCVNWETGAFNANGRRIRGRTYLVPLAGTYLESDGSISTTALGTITSAAAAALGGTGSLGVWTRPSAGESDGTFNIAISALVKDKVAVLTSRRD